MLHQDASMLTPFSERPSGPPKSTLMPTKNLIIHMDLQTTYEPIACTYIPERDLDDPYKSRLDHEALCAELTSRYTSPNRNYVPNSTRGALAHKAFSPVPNSPWRTCPSELSSCKPNPRYGRFCQMRQSRA